jgi:hypothetical protein
MIIVYEVDYAGACVFAADISLVGPSLADAAAWFSNGKSLSPSESILMIITDEDNWQ